MSKKPCEARQSGTYLQFQHLKGWGRRVAISSRLAWATQWTQSQPELNNETCLKKTKGKQTNKGCDDVCCEKQDYLCLGGAHILVVKMRRTFENRTKSQDSMGKMMLALQLEEISRWGVGTGKQDSSRTRENRKMLAKVNGVKQGRCAWLQQRLVTRSGRHGWEVGRPTSPNPRLRAYWHWTTGIKVGS